MVLTGENRSIRATFPTTNFTGSGLASNAGLRGDKRLRCSVIVVKMSSPYLAVNTIRLGYKNQPVNVV